MKPFAMLVCVLCVVGAALFSGESANAATFTVNSTRDDNGACQALSVGNCTLREAITAANATTTADTINFNIPTAAPQVIAPTSNLPVITAPIIINGYTQPGTQRNTFSNGGNAVITVTLDGSQIPGILSQTGLDLRGGNSIISGLNIRNCAFGLSLAVTGANRVTGNLISKNSFGVFIHSNSTDNVIGGTAVADFNAISSNGDGISISGDVNNSTARGNLVQGNSININSIGVRLRNAPNNTIGGNTASACNFISNSSGDGIVISGTASVANRIEGNFIGVGATGNFITPNGGDGIEILNAPRNIVGGTVAGARNIISGNAGRGIAISGTTAVGNIVQGNFIGTNAAGTAALVAGITKDGGHGVQIFNGANSNIIGGSTAATRNIISGNRGDGVRISGISTQITRSNSVGSNFIGLNAAGTGAIANAGNGVTIENAGANSNLTNQVNTIASNTISGNTLNGILVSGALSNFNEINSNFIGTNAGATAAIANGGNGILVQNATRIITNSNAIAGNALNGILLEGSSICEVTNNNIGMRTAGVEIVNGGHGILARLCNSISLPFGNTILGNRGDGVRFEGGSGHIVENNFIGKIGSIQFGNVGHGISFDGATNCRVGGGTALPNSIAFNGGDGVFVAANCSGININEANNISSNGGLGIDLAPDGPTPNDLGDTDTGANQLQNFPILDVRNNANGLPLHATLNSQPNTTYRVAFFETGGDQVLPGGSTTFASGPPDPSGFGESGRILGAQSVTTDANGNVSFDVNLPLTQNLDGRFITATATDPQGNTSEFSRAVQVPTVDMALTMIDSPDPVIVGEVLTYTLRATNLGTVTRQAQIRDQLPSSVTNIEVTTTQGTPVIVGNRVDINFGPLEPGGIIVVTIRVRQPVPATLTNSATISGNFIDSNPANNTATATTVVQFPTVDMTLTVTDTPDPVTAGEILTYTLSVTNNGPITRLVQLADTLPAGVEFIGATANQGTPIRSGNTVNVNFGPLEPGGIITVIIRVRPPVSATITNTATISGNFTDSNPADNTVTTSTTVLPRVDLSLTGTAPSSIDIDDTLTYTLKVKNLGRRDANSVSLINDLPTGVEFLGATPAIASQVGRRLTFNLGPLVVDAEKTITIRVRPTVPGRLINVARVLLGAGQSDPNSSNNVISFNTTVTDCARDAGSQVVVTRGGVQFDGDLFSCLFLGSCGYREVVTLKNNGTTSLAGPLSLVLDNLPAGITLLNPAGTTLCNAPLGSPFVQISPTALAAGASVQVTLQFQTSGERDLNYDPRVLYGAGQR